jgi:hypothetical protein
MPHLTFPINPDGLTLTVLIAPGRTRMLALQATGQAIPAPSSVRAVIDSASDLCCVSLPVLNALSLPPQGTAKTYTAGGSVTTRTYRVSLSIFGPAGTSGPMLTVPELAVAELRHTAPGLDVLIGMNLLADCLLIVDGPGGRFTLSF